jgi:asparagine synthase (glutamine-hydrolysing)
VGQLKNKIEDLVSDDELKNAERVYPRNTPQTKEEYYYRTLYSKEYPRFNGNNPYKWMPRWQKNNVTDPSATVLSHHNKLKYDS